jgi:hypothetical protein
MTAERTHLSVRNLLEVRPGVGTVVAELPGSTAAERGNLEEEDMSNVLAVEDFKKNTEAYPAWTD